MKKYIFNFVGFAGGLLEFDINAENIDTAWQEAVNYCISVSVLPVMKSLTLINVA